MTGAEALTELIERARGAADSLYWLAEARTSAEAQRIEAKRQGVLLVKGYAEEALRMLGRDA